MATLTVDDLKKIKEKTAPEMALRQTRPTARITVHIGDCGLAAGAREVMKAFMEVREQAKRPDIYLLAADCIDPEDCANEPKVTIQTEGQSPAVHTNVTPEKARELMGSVL